MSTRTPEQIAEHIDAEVRKFTGHTGALPDFTPLIEEAVADKERELAEVKATRAQLVADGHENMERLEAERDRLRAEVERLQDVTVNGAGAVCLTELRARVAESEKTPRIYTLDEQIAALRKHIKMGKLFGSDDDGKIATGVLPPTREETAKYLAEERADLIAAIENANIKVNELEQDRARLDWLLDNAELCNPQNCSECWDTRAAIDAAQKGTQ